MEIDSTQIEVAAELIQALGESGHVAVLIGGVAVSLMAVPRFTKDVDAMAVVDVDDLGQIMARLTAHGFRPLFSDAVAFARSSRILPLLHSSSSVKVDVSLGSTPFEQQTIDRSSMTIVLGSSIRLPSPEDLIILKAIAHRPHDMIDIERISEMYPDLDTKRIQQWVVAYAELLDEPDLWRRIKALL